MNNNELAWSTRCIRKETTEDGDIQFTLKVFADSIEGTSDFEKEYKTILDWNPLPDGTFEGEYSYVVEGAVYAIEKSNDYWASMSDDR
jgi:hypothetical protein